MMPDPFNESDGYAMAVRTVEERMIVGYFPRYLARDAWRLLQECHPDFMRIFVERVNADAPLQQRLLCRMNACWPAGFHPCSDDSFLPIPDSVPAGCPA